jgi:uncharacterized repeat protein (TIGR01451 family)
MSRAPARRVATVTALVVGAWVVALAGLGGTASGGLRAKAAPFAPSRLEAIRVSIGMRVVPRIAKQGQTVTYLTRVTNSRRSTDPALQLLVCNQVPQGLTLVSAPPDFALGRGRSVCRRFTRLPIGVTLILNFRMKVSLSAKAGVVVNTASAKAPGMARSVKAQAQLRVLGPCPSRFAGPLC